jgi:acyl carrier protein
VGAEQSKAREIIETFLVRSKKSHDGLADDLHLYGDGLGLDSLEAAELSAMLEDELGTDPFSAGGELPETVGDVLAFYGVPSNA